MSRNWLTEMFESLFFVMKTGPAGKHLAGLRAAWFFALVLSRNLLTCSWFV